LDFTKVNLSESVYESCWFICDTFKWKKPGKLLDGDVNLIDSVVSEVISSLRGIYEK
jgi:hypothetical protein